MPIGQVEGGALLKHRYTKQLYQGLEGFRSTWALSQSLHHHYGRLGVQQRLCRLSQHRRVAGRRGG